MDYIKTIKRIQNNKIIIDIPKDFKSEEVEVIVLPINDENELSKEFMKVSEDSFKEWDNNADEIYNKL